MLISWKEKKNRICKLIKLISDHHGGEDDLEELRDYCKTVIESHKDDLNVPLATFLLLADSLGINYEEPEELIKFPIVINICPWCKYVPPFCDCPTFHEEPQKD